MIQPLLKVFGTFLYYLSPPRFFHKFPIIFYSNAGRAVQLVKYLLVKIKKN